MLYQSEGENISTYKLGEELISIQFILISIK